MESQPLPTANFTPIFTWAAKATSSELPPGAGGHLGSGSLKCDHEDQERFSAASFKECVTLVGDQGSLH